MARWRLMQLGKTGTAAISAALALLLAAKPGVAGTIVIDVGDDTDTGFNDPTTADAGAGHQATTRGAEALAAFNRAAGIWSAALRPSVDIHVLARFTPLDCAIYAKGEPAQYKPVPGGVAGTLYPLALANHLAKADLATGQAAINLTLNSSLGTPDCPTTAPWYLGLDGQGGDAPDLVTAILHELGHGLGMVTAFDVTTGDSPLGSPDIYSTLVVDDRTGKAWSEMSAPDRATSARDFHHLVWGGARVTEAAKTQLTLGMPELALGGTLQDLDPAIVVATTFGGPPLTTGTQPVEGVLATVADGCGTPPALAGKIAFIEPGGTCSDFARAVAVQGQGAIGAVLVSSKNQPPEPSRAGGDTGTVAIPVVAIGQTDAGIIRSVLNESASDDASAGLTAKLWANPARAFGTSKSGRVLLYATDPAKLGSSVTHWDPSARPPLLMQPSYAQTNQQLDLTLPLMEDIGWASCGAGCGPSTDGGTLRDAGVSGTTGGGIPDASISDAGSGDAGDAFAPNTNPPPPNRYIDGGPSEGDGGLGGIPWAPRPKGCSCHVGTEASEPGGVAAMLVGLAALMRRRRAKNRA